MSAEQLGAARAAALAHPSSAAELGSALSDEVQRRPRNQMRRNLKRFLVGNRLNLAGVIIVAMFVFLSIPVGRHGDGSVISIGEAISPHDPFAQDIRDSKLLAPSLDHPLGTDELGRDVFSRILTGTMISLRVALVVLTFAVLFGTLVGAVSGYFGGFVDEILMRFTDMFLAFPALVLAIAIASTLGKSLTNTMIALSTVFWPWYARLVRAQVLSVREREYVEAARSIGMSSVRLMIRHILPNVVAVVIIQVTLDVGYAILATSSLSFIGLGAQPPSPEWGTMLSTARNYYRDAWWYMTFPGIALTLTVLAFNLLGDGLQEALDPRSGRR